MVLHLCRFPFRYLHEALQLVRCHYKLVQHHGSEFSLDLRARYSAMLVSKLLRVVRKIVVLCWFHLSAQEEVENFVSEIFKNELFASSLLDHVCCESESKKPPSCPKQKSCLPLHAISASLHKTLCTPTCLPFRDRIKPFSS